MYYERLGSELVDITPFGLCLDVAGVNTVIRYTQARYRASARVSFCRRPSRDARSPTSLPNAPTIDAAAHSHHRSRVGHTGNVESLGPGREHQSEYLDE